MMMARADGYLLHGVGTPSTRIFLAPDGGGWRVVEVDSAAETVLRCWEYDGGDLFPAFLAVCRWHASTECGAGSEPAGWVRRVDASLVELGGWSLDAA